MLEYGTKPLAGDTWNDFANLVEENNGVWGGGWCLWYHDKEGEKASPEEKRAMKEPELSRAKHTQLWSIMMANAWAGVSLARPKNFTVFTMSVLIRRNWRRRPTGPSRVFFGQGLPGQRCRLCRACRRGFTN
ncbi:hypothetical protein [uncultured Roseobacter sp.]|uniref:hypothetical protein n=1 Tax=uncultured Roseobacter sp. TaxID=114847 RepID=UPI0026157921|nr:hypothetical protein [uncultured Roseobacter sp.]